MYYTTKPTLVWVFLCVLLFVSCEEICDCDPTPCQFSYDGISFTPDTDYEQMITPNITEGEEGGTFSATPSGLDLNQSTGEINVNNSTPNEYTITYTPENDDPSCTTTIIIQEPDPVLITCNLDYGKTLFIPGQDMFASPISPTSEEIKGTFSANPGGLDIDPETGIINIDLSEPGLLYTIKYISEDSLTSCQTEILVAGIDYPDMIVDFSDTDTPPYIEPIVNRDNPDYVAEIQYDPDGQAAQQGIAFQEVGQNSSLGTINLQQTLINLEQLGIEVMDGFSMEFYIPYTYRGNNTVAEGSIPIQIYWYEDEIPDDLEEWIGRRNQESDNGRLMHRHSIMVGNKKFQ